MKVCYSVTDTLAVNILYIYIRICVTVKRAIEMHLLPCTVGGTECHGEIRRV